MASDDQHGVRTFTDDDGTAWEVWEAHPRLADRRSCRERRAQRRDGADRRSAPTPSGLGAAGLQATNVISDGTGWLVFRSAREERRRTPIPAGWEAMSDEQLAGLHRLSRATGPVPRMRPPSERELGR